MIQLIAFHINTDHPEELGEFYKNARGLEPAWSTDDLMGFMVSDFRLEIARHDQVSGKNTQPARLFFNLLVEDVQAEFDRIIGLGAPPVQEPYEFTDDGMNLVIATLADPDGNYFQLVSMESE